MKYYSTNKNTPAVSLKEAVIKGLASDKGLFMPERIERFEPDFFENIHNLSFQEIAFEVAKKFFGEDVEEASLKEIVYDTLEFDCPVVKVSENIWSLELFHGPHWLLKMWVHVLWPGCSTIFWPKTTNRFMCWWPPRAIRAAPWPTDFWEWKEFMCMCCIPKEK
jgi:hypothetical protein